MSLNSSQSRESWVNQITVDCHSIMLASCMHMNTQHIPVAYAFYVGSANDMLTN